MKNCLKIIFFNLIFYSIAATAMEEAIFDPNKGYWLFNYKDNNSGEINNLKFVPRNTYTSIAVSDVEFNKYFISYKYIKFNHSSSNQIIIGSTLYDFNNLSVMVNFPEYAIERATNLKLNDRPQTMVNRLYLIDDAVKKQFDLPKHYMANPGSQQKKSQFLMESAPGPVKVIINNIMLGPNFSPEASNGVYPGGFSPRVVFNRPEMPGVIFMRFSTMPVDEKAPNETAILNQLPDTPYFEKIIRQLATDAYKHTPLLGPAVEVPNPFKTSVYLDNLITEVNTWAAKKVASPFMVEQLNRSLYSVKTLADGKDKERALAEVNSLLKTVLATQTAPALTVNNLLQDGWENQPVAFIESQRDAVMGAALKANNGLHRIAARALAINLQFLSKQIAGR